MQGALPQVAVLEAAKSAAQVQVRGLDAQGPTNVAQHLATMSSVD